MKSVSTPAFTFRAAPAPPAGPLTPGESALFGEVSGALPPGTGSDPQSSTLSKSASFSSDPWATLESSFAAAAQAPPAAINGSPSSSSPSSTTSSSPHSPSHTSKPSAPYLAPVPPRVHPYNDQFLWNFYLAYGFLTALPHASYWLIPLVHGFFAQQLLRHQHHDVLVTLLARRSRHFAGTRYIKRGIDSRGHVANEVETEQLLEVVDAHSTWFNTGASYSSVLLMRGSIPLVWWQENVQSLKPNIVVAPSQDGYTATKAHIDDLIRRYGRHLDLLSLIKKEERNPQETRLGYAYTAAVAALRALYREEDGVVLDYQTYDFINMRSAKANVLRDVRNLVSPAVEAQGVFAHVHVIEKEELKDESAVTGASGLLRREKRMVRRSTQRGIVRINCVDCLDRTNVAQFCVGKEAMRLQLQQLGLLGPGSTERVWPELLQVLQRFFTQHGDRIAQQYAGSGAMHRDALYDKEAPDDAAGEDSDLISGGVGQATRDRLTAENDGPNRSSSPIPSLPGAAAASKGPKAGAGLAHNAISFAKRYYANNLTDVEKQQAINVFLGHFIPTADRRHHVWDEDASAPLMEFDVHLGERGNDFFFAPFNPNFLAHAPTRKRRKGAAGEEGEGETVEGGGDEALSRRFGAFFSEKYNPTKLTSLERELSKAYQRPVYVGPGLVLDPVTGKSMPVATVAAKDSTPLSQGSTGSSGSGSLEPSPIILSSSYSSTSLPPLPLLQDDGDPTAQPSSPRSTSRNDGASDVRSAVSPGLGYTTPPHSPSPHSLSRHNSIDQPSPHHSSAPPSPSHHLSPTNSTSAVDSFNFNLSAGVSNAPHPGHRSGLAQANAVANKVGQATKSFFTKGLKTAFAVATKGVGGGGGSAAAAAGNGVERHPLHRVRSTGNVNAGAPGQLALPVAHLANSRSQDFHFVEAGNAVTLAHASAAPPGSVPLTPMSPASAGGRKGLPPPHAGLSSSSSSFPIVRAASPVGSSVPRDMGPGMTRLDDLVAGVSKLPSYYTQDSPQHQQMMLAQKILQQEALAHEAQKGSPTQHPTTSASTQPQPTSYEDRYLTPRNDDELFQHYLDTSRLYRPVSIEIPWTETWQIQLAAGGASSSAAESSEAFAKRGRPSLASVGRVSLSLRPVTSVAQQLSDEVEGDVSLVTSTILDGVEGGASAEKNQELEERGLDPLAQSTEVPGDSDEAAVAKLAGEIDD